MFICVYLPHFRVNISKYIPIIRCRTLKWGLGYLKNEFITNTCPHRTNTRIPIGKEHMPPALLTARLYRGWELLLGKEHFLLRKEHYKLMMSLQNQSNMSYNIIIDQLCMHSIIPRPFAHVVLEFNTEYSIFVRLNAT